MRWKELSAEQQHWLQQRLYGNAGCRPVRRAPFECEPWGLSAAPDQANARNLVQQKPAAFSASRPGFIAAHPSIKAFANERKRQNKDEHRQPRIKGRHQMPWAGP